MQMNRAAASPPLPVMTHKKPVRVQRHNNTISPASPNRGYATGTVPILRDSPQKHIHDSRRKTRKVIMFFRSYGLRFSDRNRRELFHTGAVRRQRQAGDRQTRKATYGIHTSQSTYGDTLATGVRFPGAPHPHIRVVSIL